jgi:hypothetical protein
MSRWAFSLQMDAGLSLLAGHLVKIILRTDGPRLYLNVGEAGESNFCEGNVFSAILQAVGAHAFSAAGKGCTITSVPAPWSVWIKPTSMPTPQDLLGAELALELWLLPSEDINDLDGARKSLEARRSSLNEAPFAKLYGGRRAINSPHRAFIVRPTWRLTATRKPATICGNVCRGWPKGRFPDSVSVLGNGPITKGSFGSALRCVSEGMAVRLRAAPLAPARLIANVFSDLGALSAARRLAEEALADQEIGGDPEAYKTLGRCGEICPACGRPAARCRFLSALARSPGRVIRRASVSGQTAVYRGHVALLAGRLDEAADRYAEAHAPMRARIPASMPMP